MFKGIIFDMDGVLLSTDEFHYLAWKHLADRIGVPFDRSGKDKVRGVSRMQSLEIVLGERSSKFSEEEKIALSDEKNATYRNLLANLNPSDVSCDVRDTLERIRAAGIKTAIGSSSKNAKFIMEKTDICGLFDAVSDGNNISRSKPDPEVFLKAAEFLRLSPSECIVVEDAHAGIEAAKRGGFTAIAIGDACSDPRADYKLSKLSDLIDILKI